MDDFTGTGNPPKVGEPAEGGWPRRRWVMNEQDVMGVSGWPPIGRGEILSA